AALRRCGQVFGSPSGDVAHSCRRHSSPSSPPPARNAGMAWDSGAGSTVVMRTSGIRALPWEPEAYARQPQEASKFGGTNVAECDRAHSDFVAPVHNIFQIGC